MISKTVPNDFTKTTDYDKAAQKGFEPLETDVPVSAVHGDPGHYFARQILVEPAYMDTMLLGLLITLA